MRSMRRSWRICREMVAMCCRLIEKVSWSDSPLRYFSKTISSRSNTLQIPRLTLEIMECERCDPNRSVTVPMVYLRYVVEFLIQRHPERTKWVEGSVGSWWRCVLVLLRKCLGVILLYVVSLRQLVLAWLLCRSLDWRSGWRSVDAVTRISRNCAYGLSTLCSIIPYPTSSWANEVSRRICRVMVVMCSRFIEKVSWSNSPLCCFFKTISSRSNALQIPRLTLGMTEWGHRHSNMSFLFLWFIYVM
jgi:hypothetical protein